MKKGGERTVLPQIYINTQSEEKDSTSTPQGPTKIRGKDIQTILFGWFLSINLIGNNNKISLVKIKFSYSEKSRTGCRVLWTQSQVYMCAGWPVDDQEGTRSRWRLDFESLSPTWWRDWLSYITLILVINPWTILFWILHSRQIKIVSTLHPSRKLEQSYEVIYNMAFFFFFGQSFIKIQFLITLKCPAHPSLLVAPIFPINI